MLDWGNRFIQLLEQTFQFEHLTSSSGNSYGAGSPVSAGDLLQAVIPGEDLEHYPEILVDEWAAQHLIQQQVGFDTLLEFDFEESPEVAGLVQFVLLDNEYGRSFLGRKLPGEALHFLVAVDPEVRANLVAATILALMAAEAVFGEGTDEVQIPSTITNRHPEVVSREVLEKGVSLMLDHAESRGAGSWQRLAEGLEMEPGASQQATIAAYFNSAYTELEPW